MSFTSFDTEERFDELLVWDHAGQLVLRHSGATTPSSLVSKSFRLLFTSDASEQRFGFKARYEVHAGPPETLPAVERLSVAHHGQDTAVIRGHGQPGARVVVFRAGALNHAVSEALVGTATVTENFEVVMNALAGDALAVYQVVGQGPPGLIRNVWVPGVDIHPPLPLSELRVKERVEGRPFKANSWGFERASAEPYAVIHARNKTTNEIIRVGADALGHFSMDFGMSGQAGDTWALHQEDRSLNVSPAIAVRQQCEPQATGPHPVKNLRNQMTSFYTTSGYHTIRPYKTKCLSRLDIDHPTVRREVADRKLKILPEITEISLH